MTRSEASAEPGGHPKQGAVTPRRPAVGKTRLSPSQGPYQRPTSLRPMPVRPHGRGLSKAPPPAPSGCRPSDTQPHVACMGVETIASRAVISLYQLIRRYSKRHGLRRPREVGRRAAGRCASGGRAGCHSGCDTDGKRVNPLPPPGSPSARPMARPHSVRPPWAAPRSPGVARRLPVTAAACRVWVSAAGRADAAVLATCWLPT